MTDLFAKYVIIFVCQLALTILPQLAAATEPLEYTAVYEVVRNGEQVANVTLELSEQDGEWTYLGFTHNMQGLGKVLRVQGRQDVTGAWRDGRFQPRKYTFSFSLMGYRSRWSADFDWPNGTVVTGKKKNKTTLPLDGGAMDAMSLFLNTGSMLSAGRSHMDITLIDEDELDSQLYHAHPGESLQTALGCMKATRVERIRENSKRQSTAWYADELGYIPLKLQHLKKKKSSVMYASIISLLVEGQEIPAAAACPPGNGFTASS